MAKLDNSSMTYTELQSEKRDLDNACSSGDYCGEDLENYRNKCCDVKTGVRCFIARLLDENKLKME